MVAVSSDVPRELLGRFEAWIQDSDWEATKSEVLRKLIEYAVENLDLDDLFEEEEEVEEEEAEGEESEEEED